MFLRCPCECAYGDRKNVCFGPILLKNPLRLLGVKILGLWTAESGSSPRRLGYLLS
jgi:hypothetical protein